MILLIAKIVHGSAWDPTEFTNGREFAELDFSLILSAHPAI